MEVEYTQITLDQWVQWKEDIRRKLAETAGNFVYIGYRLKQIRESGMFDGAADIFEFARKEYGLGKSTVSRFIAINEKYSEGGNSLELKEEFKNFSSSKLSEMLTLPDSEVQLITERTTIKEIRQLKEFDRQDPAQVAVEGEEVKYTPLEKCLIDFFETQKEMLNEIMKALNNNSGYKEAAEIMNPSGQSSHKKGIIFLFMYDFNTGVKYKSMASPEPVSMTWAELLDTVYKIYQTYDFGDVWDAFYSKKTEEKSEVEKTPETESNQGKTEFVATSQQGEKSTHQMTIHEVEESIPEPDRKEEIAITEEPEPVAVPEEQIPGQTDIENDFPEMLPEVEEQNKPDEVAEVAVKKVEGDVIEAAPAAVVKKSVGISDLLDETYHQSRGIYWRMSATKLRPAKEYRSIREELKKLDDKLVQLIRYAESQEEEK